MLATTTLVDSITALVSPALARALRSSPAISQVVPDIALGSSPPAPATPAESPDARSKPVLVPHHVAPASLFCGTRSHPELDPQALQVVRANQARAMGADGSGVTVAVLADGLHPTNADFLRNPAYGRAGSPVITEYQDFSGEGTAAKTDGAEAFGDASSIAAQGNKVYNLAQYVNPDLASVLPKNGCWVKIVGVAPGASLLVLKVIGRGNGGSASSILQGSPVRCGTRGEGDR